MSINSMLLYAALIFTIIMLVYIILAKSKLHKIYTLKLFVNTMFQVAAIYSIGCLALLATQLAKPIKELVDIKISSGEVVGAESELLSVSPLIFALVLIIIVFASLFWVAKINIIKYSDEEKMMIKDEHQRNQERLSKIPLIGKLVKR